MSLGPIETVRIFTADMPRSKAFYEEVLGLAPLVVDASACLFDTGQAKLLVEQVDPGNEEDRSLVGRFAGFSFTVEAMAEVVGDLEQKGARLTAPPEAQNWGGILAHFADPDGNILTLVQYPAPCAALASDVSAV